MVLTESNYLSPSFFQDFRCYADKCMDTCCQGFSIPLDTQSLTALYKFAELYMPDAVKHIQNTSKGVFIKFQNSTCPFLKHNLCMIHSVGGERYLSYICRKYPRTTVNLGDRMVKHSLFLSCEAVVKTVICWENPINELWINAEGDNKSNSFLIKQNTFLIQSVSKHFEISFKKKLISRQLLFQMDITDKSIIEFIPNEIPVSTNLTVQETKNLLAYYIWHYFNGNNEAYVQDVSSFMITLIDVCISNCRRSSEKAMVIHKLSKEIEHSDSNMAMLPGFLSLSERR